MGLAYRELIGSLYESWTIGIERVCKKLINSLIQQCQKCQKWGFEAKERESSPRSHTLLFGDFSQGEGECSDRKGGVWWREKMMKHSPIHILRYRGLPFKGGM